MKAFTAMLAGLLLSGFAARADVIIYEGHATSTDEGRDNRVPKKSQVYFVADYELNQFLIYYYYQKEGEKRFLRDPGYGLQRERLVPKAKGGSVTMITVAITEETSETFLYRMRLFRGTNVEFTIRTNPSP